MKLLLARRVSSKTCLAVLKSRRRRLIHSRLSEDFCCSSSRDREATRPTLEAHTARKLLLPLEFQAEFHDFHRTKDNAVSHSVNPLATSSISWIRRTHFLPHFLSAATCCTSNLRRCSLLKITENVTQHSQTVSSYFVCGVNINTEGLSQICHWLAFLICSLRSVFENHQSVHTKKNDWCHRDDGEQKQQQQQSAGSRRTQRSAGAAAQAARQDKNKNRKTSEPEKARHKVGCHVIRILSNCFDCNWWTNSKKTTRQEKLPQISPKEMRVFHFVICVHVILEELAVI